MDTAAAPWTKRWGRNSVKASPIANPQAPAQDALGGVQKLVWQPPPLKVTAEFLSRLDVLLLESCRDTVDAMVVAYKRTHEQELATPGGADQLLAYYTECREKIVPHYMLELRQGSVQSLSVERNLQETLIALKSIPRGEIVSLLAATRGTRLGISLYLSNRLWGQSQVTVAGPDAPGVAAAMKSLMLLLGKWQLRAGFVHSRLFAILIAGALQSIYLTVLFRLLAGYSWAPSLGMVSLVVWTAMALCFYLAMPPLVFRIGIPPDRTRRRYAFFFLLLNLIFMLGIVAAIFLPT
jgi:hypothetical protein